MGKYFGTDGFRGEAGVNLTADHAYKVGTFFGEHRYYKHMEFLRELSIGYCCILNKALCNRIHNKLHNVWNIPLSHTNFLFCILPQSSSLFRTYVLPKQPSC